MSVCEFIMRQDTTCYRETGTLRCNALAERGSRYCPAHRSRLAIQPKPTPRVKHDLDLDVLPWSDADATDLNRTTRKRSLKQER